MSIAVPRTTEPLRFDVGIGSAGYADVISSPGAEMPQKAILPGTTTVIRCCATDVTVRLSIVTLPTGFRPRLPMTCAP